MPLRNDHYLTMAASNCGVYVRLVLGGGAQRTKFIGTHQMARPRGRPRKSAEEKRSERTVVRFRRDEQAQLDLFAANANQTVSNYIRASALEDRPAPRISAETKHYIYKLLRMTEVALPDAPAVKVLAARIRAELDAL